MRDPGRRGSRRAAPAPAAQDVHDHALLAEVRRTNYLLAVMAVKDMEPRDAIGFLETAGFRPAEIAAALGMTRNAVNIALHRMRKATGRQPQDERDEDEESPDGAP